MASFTKTTMSLCLATDCPSVPVSIMLMFSNIGRGFLFFIANKSKQKERTRIARINIGYGTFFIPSQILRQALYDICAMVSLGLLKTIGGCIDNRLQLRLIN